MIDNENGESPWWPVAELILAQGQTQRGGEHDGRVFGSEELHLTDFWGPSRTKTTR